jgi:phosphoglycolate phosphatase
VRGRYGSGEKGSKVESLLCVKSKGLGMNRYYYILWDWNGTLLDDVWLCIDIVNAMLTKRCIPTLDSRKYRSIFDFPVKTYYERAGFDFSKEPFDSVTTEFCDEYARRVGECRLHDGAKVLLEQCAASGVQQSILSATEQSRLETMVAAFEISDIFDRVVGQSDQHANGKIQRGKELVSSLARSCNQILLVGDTVHDSDIAKIIGIDSALVAIGHNTRERLEDTGGRVFAELSAVGCLLEREEGAQHNHAQ